MPLWTRGLSRDFRHSPGMDEPGEEGLEKPPLVAVALSGMNLGERVERLPTKGKSEDPGLRRGLAGVRDPRAQRRAPSGEPAQGCAVCCRRPPGGRFAAAQREGSVATWCGCSRASHCGGPATRPLLTVAPPHLHPRGLGTCYGRLGFS